MGSTRGLGAGGRVLRLGSPRTRARQSAPWDVPGSGRRVLTCARPRASPGPGGCAGPGPSGDGFPAARSALPALWLRLRLGAPRGLGRAGEEGGSAGRSERSRRRSTAASRGGRRRGGARTPRTPLGTCPEGLPRSLLGTGRSKGPASALRAGASATGPAAARLCVTGEGTEGTEQPLPQTGRSFPLSACRLSPPVTCEGDPQHSRCTGTNVGPLPAAWGAALTQGLAPWSQNLLDTGLGSWGVGISTVPGARPGRSLPEIAPPPRV